jgi:hypothetical protein
MCREAIDAVYDLEHMGMPFDRTPDGRIDQRRFGGHTHHHGSGAVRRSCFAADRTGHMILQTLYQQNVKQDTTFFNEFYVLDLLLAEGPGGAPRAAGVVASCPVFWADDRYFGPAPIVNAHRFIFDSRDQRTAERLDVLHDKEGVWRCRTTFNCTDACPGGIKVTQAIQEVKRAPLFRKR